LTCAHGLIPPLEKSLDRLVAKGDYDWTLFPQILEEMVRRPLAHHPDRSKCDCPSRHLRRKQLPDAAALQDIVRAICDANWRSVAGPPISSLACWLFIARAVVGSKTPSLMPSNLDRAFSCPSPATHI
jgi:hypothetical protein